MKSHHLKTAPAYFDLAKRGLKPFEVRLNDRDFQPGDIVYLHEYENEMYTGACVFADVPYVLTDPEYCKENYVILTLDNVQTIHERNRGVEAAEGEVGHEPI